LTPAESTLDPGSLEQAAVALNRTSIAIVREVTGRVRYFCA
jgi:hypothetical protein